jgi:hypothetical protein
MSWSICKIGRAGALSKTIKEAFEKQGGCPAGSAEEAAKNAAGAMVQDLCASLENPATIVKIEACGSAWNAGDKAKTQSIDIKLDTLFNFEE